MYDDAVVEDGNLDAFYSLKFNKHQASFVRIRWGNTTNDYGVCFEPARILLVKFEFLIRKQIDFTRK